MTVPVNKLYDEMLSREKKGSNNLIQLRQQLSSLQSRIHKQETDLNNITAVCRILKAEMQEEK